MAITNAQQYQQLVNPPMKGNKRPGYRGEAAAASDRAAGRNAGRDTSPAGTGNVGGDFDRDSFRDAVRRGELKNITDRIEQEKIEEKLEKFRDLGSNQRKFQSFVSKFSPIAMFASKFGPLNTRDFFTDKVLGSKNFANMTKEKFANLTNEEQEELFDNYMDDRMSGKTDAYGNEINRGDGGDPNILLPQSIMTQAPSITEQESEETFGSNLRLLAGGGMAERAPYEGGIMDLESARQMYGLGKLVKKVTRSVKKIAKSPLGKAAILGAVGFGIPGVQSGFFSGGLFGKGAASNLFSKAFLKKGATEFTLANLSPMKTIGLASLASGLLTKKDEDDEEQQYAGADLPFPVDYYLQGNYSPNMRLAAEGGLMRAGYQEGSKEPVAKKTMPLLDMGGMEKDYREEGGFVPIGRMEKADDVPARLSKNEFVFTAEAVRNAGDGDVDLGAEKMYSMMKNLEAGR